MTENKTEFKVRLLALIEEGGFNASSLAKKIGTGRQTVDHWLKGRTMPVASNMKRLAKELDVPISWLKYGRRTDNAHVPPKIPSDNAISAPGSTNPDKAGQLPYPIMEERILPPKKDAGREPDKGSYGIPDLKKQKVVQVYQRMDHECLIKNFKNQDLAYELNSMLLKIERLDPDQLTYVRTYLACKLETLESVKKNSG